MDFSTTVSALSRKDKIKPHAVLIPAPGQGHINAMLKLAKFLHFHSGFHITFVHTTTNRDRILASRGPNALRGSPSFRFETIPDSLPPSTDHWDVSANCRNVGNSLAAPFRDLVRRLNFVPDGFPPVSCIVCDIITSFTLEAGKEIGVPVVFFCSLSACGYMGIFASKDLIERGFIPLKSESNLTNGYLDTPIEWVPGMTNMRLRDFPCHIRTTNRDDFLLNFLKDEAQEAFKADAIIINTFDVEGPLLEAMASFLPPIYAIGPLNLMCRQIQESSSETIHSHNLYKEVSGCMDWLEGKAPGSVLYVNFGSLVVMSSEEIIEFAWGLANSGHEFLWVIRPDIMKGESVILPKSFMGEVSGRGLLTGWCPQEEVLMHSSIGGFLTHCGWNSVIESISEGVPMICWPGFADQQPNCRYLCTEWGIGVEIDKNVKREDVEVAVKELLVGKTGMEMKKMATKWKECAIRATEPGGKSLQNFERVVNDILLQKKDN